jgi:hypothetical protein
MKANYSFRELIDDRSIHLTSAHQPIEHAVFREPSHLDRVLLHAGVEAPTFITKQKSVAIANYRHDTEMDRGRKATIQAHFFAAAP